MDGADVHQGFHVRVDERAHRGDHARPPGDRPFVHRGLLPRGRLAVRPGPLALGRLAVRPGPLALGRLAVRPGPLARSFTAPSRLLSRCLLPRAPLRERPPTLQHPPRAIAEPKHRPRDPRRHREERHGRVAPHHPRVRETNGVRGGSPVPLKKRAGLWTRQADGRRAASCAARDGRPRPRGDAVRESHGVPVRGVDGVVSVPLAPGSRLARAVPTAAGPWAIRRLRSDVDDSKRLRREVPVRRLTPRLTRDARLRVHRARHRASDRLRVRPDPRRVRVESPVESPARLGAERGGGESVQGLLPRRLGDLRRRDGGRGPTRRRLRDAGDERALAGWKESEQRVIRRLALGAGQPPRRFARRLVRPRFVHPRGGAHAHQRHHRAHVGSDGGRGVHRSARPDDGGFVPPRGSSPGRQVRSLLPGDQRLRHRRPRYRGHRDVFFLLFLGDGPRAAGCHLPSPRLRPLARLLRASQRIEVFGAFRGHRRGFNRDDALLERDVLGAPVAERDCSVGVRGGRAGGAVPGGDVERSAHVAALVPREPSRESEGYAERLRGPRLGLRRGFPRRVFLSLVVDVEVLPVDPAPVGPVPVVGGIVVVRVELGDATRRGEDRVLPALRHGDSTLAHAAPPSARSTL